MRNEAKAGAAGADYQQALLQTMRLVAAGRRNAEAIQEAVIEGQRRLETSRMLLRSAGITAASPRTFAAVDALVARIEQTITRGDPVDDLIAGIQALVPSGVDPAMLMGVLIEGIAQTLLQRIPEEQCRDFVVALFLLLCQRIKLLDVGLR